MINGYMYILQCSDGSYYTGSTKDLELRLKQHQAGEGANHTKKHLPVELVYFEAFTRINDAFYCEKQIQGWSRKKKEALINNNFEKLPELSIAYRDKVASSASATEASRASASEQVRASVSEQVSASAPQNTLSPEAFEGKPTATTEQNPLPEVLEGNTTTSSGQKPLPEETERSRSQHEGNHTQDLTE